ncbi:MAG: hypothetical protein GY832_44255 [Chloroflexi bacterium]|nr:hypothetical protein [Chloroflexota bacterium]
MPPKESREEFVHDWDREQWRRPYEQCVISNDKVAGALRNYAWKTWDSFSHDTINLMILQLAVPHNN